MCANRAPGTCDFAIAIFAPALGLREVVTHVDDDERRIAKPCGEVGGGNRACWTWASIVRHLRRRLGAARRLDLHCDHTGDDDQRDAEPRDQRQRVVEDRRCRRSPQTRCRCRRARPSRSPEPLPYARVIASWADRAEDADAREITDIVERDRVPGLRKHPHQGARRSRTMRSRTRRAPRARRPARAGARSSTRPRTSRPTRDRSSAGHSCDAVIVGRSSRIAPTKPSTTRDPQHRADALAREQAEQQCDEQRRRVVQRHRRCDRKRRERVEEHEQRHEAGRRRDERACRTAACESLIPARHSSAGGRDHAEQRSPEHHFRRGEMRRAELHEYAHHREAEARDEDPERLHEQGRRGQGSERSDARHARRRRRAK